MLLLAARRPRFTLRQRQVIRLIAQGYSNAEIAALIGVSPRTVKAHSDVLRMKLGVSRRRHIPAAFREVTGEDPHAPQGLETVGAPKVTA